MFVLLNLRCSVKRNYLRCCDTSTIKTVYTRTMRYGWYIQLRDVFVVRKTVEVMTLIAFRSSCCLPKYCITCGRFPCSKSHIGHVNHGNWKIYCGVGVSATFLALMRCFYVVVVVVVFLRHSEPPNASPPPCLYVLFV